MKGLPQDRKSRIGLGVLALLALYGALIAGMQLSDWVQDQIVRLAISSPIDLRLPGSRHSFSVLPGPPREPLTQFILNAENAERMAGQDLVEGERWSDIAGNHYGDSFAKAFSYTHTPQVWVRIESTGDTLCGRLEARNLKPFFAYQMKLMGDYDNGVEQFEAIGYSGRWRLPGDGTNYSDSDYEACEDKRETSAYLFFDFFVTDAEGNAIREFELDGSLHVLWVARQRSTFEADDAIEVEVLPSDPDVYTNPKTTPTLELLWAEREHVRYRSNQEIRLPAGTYAATLALTEESFHSIDRDGGYWGTVLELPIVFEITP
ncbi:MAG: hypothetical protein ACI8W8_000180 [Rhodothermales bacterium]|jgi:hypothetical protein